MIVLGKYSILVLLKIVVVFVRSSIADGRSVTDVNSKYDPPTPALFCYSKADKGHVVDCDKACIHKTLISSYKIDSEYSLDFHYRVGCESKTFDETLQELKCDPNAEQGSEYTLDYIIKGDEKRSPRIFIRKFCCFNSFCNEPALHIRRNWFRRNESIVTRIKESYESHPLLNKVVYLLIGALIIYGAISMITSWLKSKRLAERSQNVQELEIDLIQESGFLESTIIDTKLEVTGRLKVKEIAHLLALLPDLDNVKYTNTRSSSAEDHTNTARKLTMSEGETSIEQKSVTKVFIKPPLKARAVGNHNLSNTIRVIHSPYDLLYRMIEHGPYQYPFTALELLSLFEETSFKMAEEPSLLQIDADITVIGDIRGKYVQLHRWLQLTGWPPRNRLLFLGGILDNSEPGSLECLALICSLKCRFPKHVYILRGEPETVPFRLCQRLHPVITRTVQSSIIRMCSHMPFAAIIGSSVLAVYSGFSPMIREKSHIHYLFRPVTFENMNAVERHIIFNQPSNLVRMYRPNCNSRGDWFGKQAVKRACKSMQCNLMIRGQSHSPFGYLPCWSNRLINLWSAPGYGTNYGAVLIISKDLIITPVLMETPAVL